MGARSKYRKRALDVLYESEARGLGPDGTLAERLEVNEPPINEYTVDLVEGVSANQDQIDALLAEFAEGWTLERMPAVDRNILRVAVFEMLHKPDVPKAVVISEAVELATELSTDESPKFVNGLLGRIAGVSAEDAERIRGEYVERKAAEAKAAEEAAAAAAVEAEREAAESRRGGFDRDRNQRDSRPRDNRPRP